jgi:hypothetical protein
MSQENVELHRQAYDAFSRRDLTPFLSLCDPDGMTVLEWHRGSGRVVRLRAGHRATPRPAGRGRPSRPLPSAFLLDDSRVLERDHGLLDQPRFMTEPGTYGVQGRLRAVRRLAFLQLPRMILGTAQNRTTTTPPSCVRMR